jgi:hypothetical protein
VTIRLEVDSDIDLLLTLVSVALQAHRNGHMAGDDIFSTACNDR